MLVTVTGNYLLPTIYLMSGKQPHDHHNNSHEEHEQRYPVHTVHELNVDVLRIVGIALAYIKVGEHLLPDTLLHKNRFV